MEIPNFWLTQLSIEARAIVVKGCVDESHAQDMILAKLTSYSESDVVEFDCEDGEGRQVSGVGTMKELRFPIRNTAGPGLVFEFRIGFGVS